MGRIEVHGHRGARARFPENTIPAFRYAVEVGVDYLEMDLGLTRDQQIIVNHDPYINAVICNGPNINRISGRGPLIHSLSLTQVKQYDCGSRRNPRFANQTLVPGTKIPTLAEVIESVRSHRRFNQVQFNIEIKTDPEHPEETASPEVFVPLVLRELTRLGIKDRTVLQSFDYRNLRLVRSQDNTLRIYALSENSNEDYVNTDRQLEPYASSLKWDFLTADLVSRLHAAHSQVIPWTANTPEAWQQLINMGVDAIITDDPEALIQYLNTH